jgi:ribonucleoside-diphosphate reductase alpha chain
MKRRKSIATLEINFTKDKDYVEPAQEQIEKHIEHIEVPLKSNGKTTEPNTSVYSREEVLESSTKYFQEDTLAANVWMNKYALKDSEGNFYEKSPSDMHWRLASELARIEAKYPNPISREELYKLLKDFKYIVPQGGPMTGIGNSFQTASLSNCFVIGPDLKADSYGSIMKADEEQVQLMKRRGGVGHDLSHIRPQGSPVMNSALSSTGVLPFMERFSNTTREVAQDGRRGALMLSLSVKHPDVISFIEAKQDRTKVTGANISVKVTDDFMQALENNKSYTLQFPIDSTDPKYKKEVAAKEVWDKIIHNAWESAEPGVLFWDNVINEAIPDCYSEFGFSTVSTNPCGEIPLCPYDSCRLVAINLYSYVDQPFSEEAVFNFEKFKQHVRIAQRIMDDVVDLEIEKIDAILLKINKDPEPQEIKQTELNLWKKIKKKCLQGRRTGLGITGEGDMLAALNIRYGSDESLDFAENIQQSLALEAYRSSVEMAEERGFFEIYDAKKEKDNRFINRIKSADPELFERMVEIGRRNISILTIAPTGTTSLMTQTTSGLEPAFKVSYTRRRKVNPEEKDAKVSFTDESGDTWEEYHILHHKFKTWLSQNEYDPAEVAGWPEDKLNDLIAKSPYHKSTAADIDWIKKVQLQGRLQKWVDHSISVTVNVPTETTEQTIEQIYLEGWKAGCKGITVYREGSRDGVLVANSDSQKEESIKETNAPKRPKTVNANILRFNNDNEKWIAVIGELNGKPYEIFTGKAEDSFSIPSHVMKGWITKNRNKSGKSRYDFRYKDKDGFNVTIEGLSRSFNPEFWNYAKLISGVLRHGMPLKYVVNLVENLHLNEDSLNTWKNGMVRALSKLIPDGEIPLNNVCTSCGETTLVYEEGCLNCKNCGHSKCG